MVRDFRALEEDEEVEAEQVLDSDKGLFPLSTQSEKELAHSANSSLRSKEESTSDKGSSVLQGKFFPRNI